MRISLIFIVLIVYTGCVKSSSPQKPVSFQNILLIVSDDLANHAVGCYGNSSNPTPNIDRLASQGVRFSHAYANSPMCTPSRASFISGLYPHATGTTLLFTPLPDSVFTLAEHLKQFNYRTGIFGKTHFQSNLKHGFDTIVTNQDFKEYIADRSVTKDSTHPVRPTWKPFRDHARIWLNAEGASSGYPSSKSQGTFFAEAAIQFMGDQREDNFFAVASFNEPHSPFNFSTEFYGRYEQDNINLPKIGSEDSLWVPKVFSDLNQIEKQGIVRSYYQSVQYMDYNVGLLLDALDSLGLAENTLVILFGDHGYLLNHHGRFEKHMMWEEAIKTPLVIRGYKPGMVVDVPVSLVDIVPTIVNILELSSMPNIHGESMLPLLIDSGVFNRSYVFAEYTTDNKAMILNDGWKYIFATGERDLGSGYETGNGPAGITHRLYDLNKDIQEQTNVAHLYPTQLKSLQSTLLKQFRLTHPRRHMITDTMMIEEQLSLFCQPVESNFDPTSR